MLPPVATQHKALFLESENGPYIVKNVKTSDPGPGEVLVKVEAASLNPVDWKIHNFIKEFPLPIGCDSAGVVAQVGEGVTRVQVGDRVAHQGGYAVRIATFQEYTIIDEELVVKIPDSMSFDQAASIPVAVAAPAIGLYGDKVPLGGAGLIAPWQHGGHTEYAKKPILVMGGASSVGQYAIQFATISRFSPIITTVSPENKDLAASTGATHTLGRSLSPSTLADAVVAITSDPITVVFDAISTPETQEAAYKILAPGGTLVVVQDEAIKTKQDDKKVVRVIASGHIPANARFAKDLYAHLGDALASGEIKPCEVEILPGGLNGVAEGLERLKNGTVRAKKLVIRPPETSDL
ncbi:hypothetical protein EIP91_007248 [Steccherinum ochraceum]|uniref:Enoyl reductase (ER) domain-containing protein n=1 Tax=Steccherinum ochraceum TaxID=92696 RepID=A0A4R0R4E7_9APHY|nr:hypothetical protein EIP91_007248 [Steccherinum ochraceum]